MSYKIRLSRLAEQDLLEAMLWYERQKVGLSIALVTCIEAGLEQIKRNPVSAENKYKSLKKLMCAFLQ